MKRARRYLDAARHSNTDAIARIVTLRWHARLIVMVNAKSITGGRYES